MINENDIELYLKERLSEYGFKVLKLVTPGNAGVMDRMILRPKYSPGPPVFVELKRPGKKLRPLQMAVAADWGKRGCDVRKVVTSKAEVDELCTELLEDVIAYKERSGSGGVL